MEAERWNIFNFLKQRAIQKQMIGIHAKKCPIALFIILNNYYKIYQLQLIKPIQFTYDKYNMT